MSIHDHDLTQDHDPTQDAADAENPGWKRVAERTSQFLEHYPGFLESCDEDFLLKLRLISSPDTDD